jgi:hypothetical protein
VDERLQQLDAAKGQWAGMSCAERAALLRQCLQSAIEVGRCRGSPGCLAGAPLHCLASSPRAQSSRPPHTARCLWQVAPELAAAGTRAKGSYGSGCGEELVGLLPVVFALKEYVEAMQVGARGRQGAAGAHALPSWRRLAATEGPCQLHSLTRCARWPLPRLAAGCCRRRARPSPSAWPSASWPATPARGSTWRR